MSLYTVGYQGIDIEIFLQSLLDAGVNQVIDVRQYPNLPEAWLFKDGVIGKAGRSEHRLLSYPGYWVAPSR